MPPSGGRERGVRGCFPVPSLPSLGRGVLRAPRVLSPLPLATCCPRRGRAGAGGAGGSGGRAPGTAAASRLPQADNALLSLPSPDRASFRRAGRTGAGCPRPGTRARPAWSGSALPAPFVRRFPNFPLLAPGPRRRR